jgi:arylsulfatase A-like enzyme
MRTISRAAVRTFVAFVVLAVSAGTAAAQPNIVYFLVDDLGSADCGFTGGKDIRTPQIDKLAAAGCRLTAYYVQPVCSPTRAALLTGRYPMRHGLQVGVVRPWATYGLPLEETTVANDLQTAGYATGIFGKWHLGHVTPEYLPTRRGFTKQHGLYNGAFDYFTHRRDGGLDWHEDDQPLEEEGYATTLIGQHAARFVRDNAGQRPFFAYVAFNGVHAPYQPPRGGARAYSDLPAGNRRKYAAMLTAVDDAIGEVVAAVDAAGVRDNTLFIFSSDNGGPEPGRVTDNGPLRAGKATLYEGGVRVAAFATWDGHVPAGATNDEPMHAVDWRPTLQKLCGGSSNGSLPLDGLDIWPTLVNSAPSPHADILLNTTPQNGAVRAGDWKLIVRQNGENAVELFDVRNDPNETKNLAGAQPEKVAELRAILEKYQAEAVPPKDKPRPANFQAPAVWGLFDGF